MGKHENIDFLLLIISGILFIWILSLSNRIRKLENKNNIQ